ncbi:MAG: glycosyl hydrolase family 65 protein [Candidatus Omnitrophota bacterium]
MNKESPWKLIYENFKPAEEGLREALCTLGNGYFATRGAANESVASKIHYPGTHVAGLYNRLATTIAGRTIVNEDLVNCPNWIFLTFKIGSGEWFYPSTAKILSYRQELDLYKGVLLRKIRFKNHQGKTTQLEIRRIVSMDDCHCGAFEYVITPENYSDWIAVRTMLDGTVLNTGVERYRQLNAKHWLAVSLGSFSRNGIYLSMKTSQSHVNICTAATVRVFVGNKEKRFAIRHLMKGKERIGQEFRIFAREKTSYHIEKAVYFYTSRDEKVLNAETAAVGAVNNAYRFSALLRTHQQAWESLWDVADIKIEGDTFSQRVVRLNIFHLFQTASLHNTSIDAGLPARGLHGEAYRGHIFWDSIFTMPFYDLHMPQVSRALLLYRYRRLAKAREYAVKKGYKGAMFPWQSGSSGREETQVMHLNPLSGKWGSDYSSNQRHVSIAIAYNVWMFWQRTEDINFLKRYGGEIILSIAQFFASLVRYDQADRRYHTKGVMGPDEFHEKMPGSSKSGLVDNAYTNLMIVWVLLRAQEILSFLPERHKLNLMNKLKLKEKDIQRWNDITRNMRVGISKDGIISQFEGYFKLKELDWQGYRDEYGNIQRLDRILKAEGKSPDEYKISKQADTLMFFYLLPSSEIQSLCKHLGYSIDKKVLRENYEYYSKRTSHGSTLSKVTHCMISLKLAKYQEAWRFFRDVLESDIYDVQGGTTPEGIHVGVMGGSFDIIVRGFAGITFFADRIRIQPCLPKRWRAVKFKLLFKERLIAFSITKRAIAVSSLSVNKEAGGPLRLEIKNKIYFLCSGKRLLISY